LSFKVIVVKMRHWSYYTNVYYKYTLGSFNIDKKVIIIIKIILHNIIFVKILIIGPKNQNWYPNCTILLEQLQCMYYDIKPQRGSL
jgi:hypothetical protein